MFKGKFVVLYFFLLGFLVYTFYHSMWNEEPAKRLSDFVNWSIVIGIYIMVVLVRIVDALKEKGYWNGVVFFLIFILLMFLMILEGYVEDLVTKQRIGYSGCFVIFLVVIVYVEAILRDENIRT